MSRDASYRASALLADMLARDNWIVGLDIGGTFTDVFMLEPDSGRTIRYKSLTTRAHPARGAMAALIGAIERAGASLAQVKVFLHATTLVANSIIERQGAVTALVTTSGFRDLLNIGREKKYDIYDLSIEKPPPLVPPGRCFEVIERIAADGSVITPIEDASLMKVVDDISNSNAEAVAICLLHSYANSAHERRVAEVLREHLPGVEVSTSSDLVPEMREYERATSTTANAYVLPMINQYLEELRDRLSEQNVTAPLFIMLSSGGISSADLVRRFPIRICESGPAAGAVTASSIGRLIDEPRVLSLDMGGTTAKACLVNDFVPTVASDFEVARMYRFKKGSGLPLHVPSVDLIEIGAGGGSIARVDKLKLLKIGPDSAGSEPGPACYGRGGYAPTVTDADLVLGYLGADSFLGGQMSLDLLKATQAIADHVAKPLGLSTVQAALGVYDIVNENMANAARIHTVERGQDPTAYTLVAFGGAGPVHAYGVAQRLGISRIVVPQSAGVGSALGLHLAPRTYHLARTYVSPLNTLDVQKVERIYAEMTQEAEKLLRSVDINVHDITFCRTADMRYRGQRKEIPVALPEYTRQKGIEDLIREAFEVQYRRVYRRIHETNEVEVLTWRLIASGPPIVEPEALPKPVNLKGARALTGRRPMLFGDWEEPRECPVYRRERLAPGRSLRGPAAIEETESTIIFGPEARAFIDQHGNVQITIATKGDGIGS